MSVVIALAVIVAARNPLWDFSKKLAVAAARLQVPAAPETVETALTEPSEESEFSDISVLSEVSELGDDGLDPIEETLMGLTGSDVECDGVTLSNLTDGRTINLGTYLAQKPVIDVVKNGRPQILIIHTHTTEGYLQEESGACSSDYTGRELDQDKNIVAVGTVIADALSEAGINTIHITDIFDDPEFNGAYDRSAEAVKKMLKKYSSIEMVIDVHRDSLSNADGTRVKPTAEIDGKKAAQVMIVAGCNEDGALEFLNWQYNLRLDVRLQQAMNELYPGLARPIYFVARRYNMHLTKNSMLVEFGTEVNTLGEALYSGRLFANSLLKTLDDL
ncbi:MAG TPA: stage II sporulation protein P [Oscillospiraceae bacterium]|nr:stage II sporulation protein P [Oscillospiraceae bacterium]HPS33706.1 stage II sporulation protein P [Oscillospiraceae bacterium]